ncbi:MAG: TonB-dependent siderophore receptor [Azospirillaceae bacterium]|nr:TonB-dependent siderophore receptor [Azospirillaceae bacterium]
MVTGSQGYQAKVSSVATRTDAPIVEVPQSVVVVPEALLNDRQPTSLDEALATVSGVKQGNTLGGTQDAILKRGFGTNRDNSIMRDGMQSVQARNFTPTTESVEVLKGPASMLYGVQDPGGIINVVTKKPQLTPGATLSGWGTSFGGGGGQVDLTGRLVGTDQPSSTTGLAYRLIADYQKYDYWRNFGQIDQAVIAPSLAWYGEKTTVAVNYERMNYYIPFDRGTQINTVTGKPLNIPREERLDEPFNITKGHSNSASLRVEQKINDDWRARFNYGYSSNYYNDHQARVISVDGTTGVATRRGDATRDADQQAHVVSADILGHFQTWGMNHELLTGVDYMHNDRVLGDLLRDTQNKTFNVYNPVYGQMAMPSTVSAKDSDQTDKLHTYAGFIQDSIHLDDKWILMAGLRYDHVHEVTGKGRPFNTNALVDDGKVVPRAGLVYMLRPEWSAYVSYTESFRPNTSIASPIGALPPEEGKAWEVGSKYVGQGFTATAALFNIDKKNVQTTQQINGEDVTRVSGKAQSRGLELDASGTLAEGWDLVASYAFTDARTIEDHYLKGNPLDGVSKHAGSLFLTHDFGQVAEGRVRGGVGERAFSSWGANDGTGKVYYLPAGAVTDAFVSYATVLGGYPVELQLNIKNMFDETYYLSDSGTGQPAITIGEPRQFMVRTRISL